MKLNLLLSQLFYILTINKQKKVTDCALYLYLYLTVVNRKLSEGKKKGKPPDKTASGGFPFVCTSQYVPVEVKFAQSPDF